MPKTAAISKNASALTPGVAEEFATSGWLVEVNLMPGDPADRRFFAVAAAHASEAVDAVLRYPGLMRSDRRIARRPLSPAELFNLKLRVEAVRPLRQSLKGVHVS